MKSEEFCDCMAYVLADNIISPLGETSEENYLAVKTGKSGIHAYAKGSHGIPDGFVASLMSLDFEELVINSAKKAIGASHVDVAHEKVALILSLDLQLQILRNNILTND
mgnify:CR=1 FL=1